jgi:flavodoxin
MLKKFLHFCLITTALLGLFFSSPILGQGPSLPEGKVLVIYFSETGNTFRLAELIAKTTNGELYRIESEPPFPTSEKEIIDSEEKRQKEGTLPTLKSPPPDLSGYSVIFFGSPVWFGDRPELVAVFLSQADFKGAKVALFATSGTQPKEILSSLSKLIKNGTVLEPGLLQKRADDWSEEALTAKVSDWLNTLFPPKS